MLKKQQQQGLFLQTRNILHAAGIGEPALSALARTVAPKRAEMWADWLCDPPASFKLPAAYAVNRLSANPLADPPGWTLQEGSHSRSRECLRGQAAAESRYSLECPGIDLNAREVWDIALKELQGQMTRATFDQLLRPTRAFGFDGDQLVVRVGSPGAKEWLELRFAAAVARTVAAVMGRAIAVRYEVF